MIEAEKQPWNPELVAARVLRLIREHRIDTLDGDDLEIKTDDVQAA